MRDSQVVHQLLVFGALSSIALAAACGGDSSRSSNSNGGNGSGGATTAASGGTDSGAGGSEATATTTAGGSSSGGTSNPASGSGGTGDGTSTGGSTASGGVGGSTTGTGGAGAQGGVGGDPSTTNAGGTTSTGGSGGDGGSGGSGGAPGPVTVVGTLGDDCDSPGALACAGNHQKLTVVCGGDGEWEANETCGATEFCDSVDGDTTGLCLEPEAECEGRSPDETFCQDGDVYSCAPDGLRPWFGEACAGFCEDGVCEDNSDRCPEESEGVGVINCDPGCGDLSGGAGCEYGMFGGNFPWDVAVGVARPGPIDSAIELDCGGTRAFLVAVGMIGGTTPVRVTVGEPWQVAASDDEDVACDAVGATCIVADAGFPTRVVVYTDQPDAGQRNITFEPVDEGAECDVGM